MVMSKIKRETTERTEVRNREIIGRFNGSEGSEDLGIMGSVQAKENVGKVSCRRKMLDESL